jgi:aldehyde dehydrogenase (NAD+)
MPVKDAPLDLLPEPGLLIGDRRLDDTSGGRFQHVYAATGKPTRDVALAGPAEIDLAVRAAREALPVWRATTADARRDAMLRFAQLLRENATSLGTVSIVDNASTFMTAMAGPFVAADLFSYNAGWADKIGGDVVETWPVPALDYTREEPYGVVGIIIPWNGPVYSTAMTVAPALAAGNCIILKPPELAPFAAIRLGELFLEAGFPPGVVNIVTAGPEGGDALVRHPGVDKIHFTGSGATAKKILASALETLKPVGLELGGKSANIVFADANLEEAAQQAISGIVNLSGQGCINGTRILVERPAYEQLVELASTFVSSVPVGDPADESTFFGPVINDAACQRILGVVAEAKSSGARLVTGGERMGGDLADGYFIAPTIFADVENRSSLAQQEVFGPVLAVMPFDTEEEAVATANDTTYGLAAYIQTNDLRRAHRVAAALEAGNVWVNGFMGIPGSVPFGGVKQSGYGRLGGIAGIREFTRPKNIWIAL